MTRVPFYRLVCLLFTSSVTIACQWPWHVTPAPPGTCANTIDFLRQPTAAALIDVTHEFDHQQWGHEWGAVDRTGGEHPFNVDVVPQGGWSVPSSTRGLAFDMFLERIDTLGSTPMALTQVEYVLEFTLPAAQCDMHVSWDADVSITLPHGVCRADDGDPARCRGGRLAADFDLFSVNDPAGTMSLSATGGGARTQLEDGVEQALNSAETVSRNRLQLVWNSQAQWQKTRTLRGTFDVASGARSHIYIGVGTQLILSEGFGWVCLRNCVTAPSDQLSDSAVFQMANANGAVGIAMSPR